MADESLEVLAQDSFGFKRLATAAGVWPHTGVVQLVDVQLCATEEELPTSDAVMTFLPGVSGLLMGDQRTRSDETTAALLTGEGALAGMDPLVRPPGVVVGERLFTKGALVELLLGVTPLVYPQVVGDSKALPAVVTSERLLTHMVQPDVGIEVRRLSETLATGSAEERPLSSMGDHVGLEVR